eukprot:scaffold10802_cov57-Attheya_sp.AAC.6
MGASEYSTPAQQPPPPSPRPSPYPSDTVQQASNYAATTTTTSYQHPSNISSRDGAPHPPAYSLSSKASARLPST